MGLSEESFQGIHQAERAETTLLSAVTSSGLSRRKRPNKGSAVVHRLRGPTGVGGGSLRSSSGVKRHRGNDSFCSPLVSEALGLKRQSTVMSVQSVRREEMTFDL